MEGRYLVPFIFQVDEMSLVTQDRFFSSKTLLCAPVDGSQTGR